MLESAVHLPPRTPRVDDDAEHEWELYGMQRRLCVCGGGPRVHGAAHDILPRLPGHFKGANEALAMANRNEDPTVRLESTATELGCVRAARESRVVAAAIPVDGDDGPVNHGKYPGATRRGVFLPPAPCSRPLTA